MLPRVVACSCILLSIIRQYAQQRVPSGSGTIIMCVPVCSPRATSSLDCALFSQKRGAPLPFAHCSCACNFARDEFVAQRIAAPRSVVLLVPVCVSALWQPAPVRVSALWHPITLHVARHFGCSEGPRVLVVNGSTGKGAE